MAKKGTGVVSKNLQISEGGIGRNISPVDRLKINNQGGTTSFWESAETVETDSLSVSKNGFYYAANDDLYAYNEIIVNVQEVSDSEKSKGTGKVTGKDPSTGDDMSVGTDEDGNLTVEYIPSKIHIVIKPRKLNYVNGDTIDYSGIHVYLMKSDNTRFTSESYPTGEIPFDELLFPVTIASAETGENPTASMDGLDPFPFSYAKPTYTWSNYDDDGGTYEYYNYNEDTGEWVYAFGEVYTAFQAEDNQYASFMAASKSPIQNIEIRKQGTRTIDGKTVYYIVDGQLNYFKGISPVVRIDRTAYSGDYAWAMLYGTITGGSQQEIPVQWIRPQDGETLEDTFMINIISEGGELEPDPEPDVNPYLGVSDFQWEHKAYNFNRSIVPPVHFANGYVWQEGISTEYSVSQASELGLVIYMGGA